MNMIVTFSLIGVGALIVVLTIWGLLSRYRRSAPDELLVVFGKTVNVAFAWVVEVFVFYAVELLVVAFHF